MKLDKKEIFNKIYKDLSKLSDIEFKDRLERHMNKDIAKSLQELGMAEYLFNRFKNEIEKKKTT